MAASRQPLLVVFGGLPGTGKTTISRELTRRLSATYLRIDAIEQSLYAAGQAGGEMGYVIANALAAEKAACRISMGMTCPLGAVS